MPSIETRWNPPMSLPPYLKLVPPGPWVIGDDINGLIRIHTKRAPIRDIAFVPTDEDLRVAKAIAKFIIQCRGR
jgi:hypothetical protein